MNTLRFTLMVVDMLIDFFERQPALAAQRGPLAAGINGLARAFRDARQPVIWIRQEFKPDLSDAFLEMRRDGIRVTIEGTDGCKILPELERRSDDRVVVKKRYSAVVGYFRFLDRRTVFSAGSDVVGPSLRFSETQPDRRVVLFSARPTRRDSDEDRAIGGICGTVRGSG